jgi:glutathione S-transferase
MNAVARAIAPGPYILGDKFTAADVVIGSNLRWATLFNLIPERKDFSDYVARIVERPAQKRAAAKDEEFAKA